jgi:hypothetical protein
MIKCGEFSLTGKKMLLYFTTARRKSGTKNKFGGLIFLFYFSGVV